MVNLPTRSGRISAQPQRHITLTAATSEVKNAYSGAGEHYLAERGEHGATVENKQPTGRHG